LDFAQIGHPLLRELDILKPFGVGNPEPLFMTSAAQVASAKFFPPACATGCVSWPRYQRRYLRRR
jgi:single-stranded DNA-specific DHH superfamily exonuclease